MLDLKTLKTINEGLDIALGVLIEENAMNSKAPYVQQFIKAQKKVRSEIAKFRQNSKVLEVQKSIRAR